MSESSLPYLGKVSAGPGASSDMDCRASPLRPECSIVLPCVSGWRYFTKETHPKTGKPFFDFVVVCPVSRSRSDTP